MFYNMLAIRVLFLGFLAVILGACAIGYDAYMSPEIESDLAIDQMSMDDEAAIKLRATSSTLALQYPIALGIFMIVSILLFRPELGKAVNRLKKECE